VDGNGSVDSKIKCAMEVGIGISKMALKNEDAAVLNSSDGAGAFGGFK
jgi:hypothetical protein